MPTTNQKRGRRPNADADAQTHEGVTAALYAAADYLFAFQKDDAHWCAELHSDSTNTAQYVFLHQMLGIDLAPRRQDLARWFLGKQHADGGYSVAVDYPGNVSITAESYLALKILGLPPEHPAQRRARAFILRHGGLARMRVFTRIFLAMFGLFSWRNTPALPAEFILLPPIQPINIYAMSSWARSTLVPLLIIAHHRPVFALPNGKSATNDYLDELWLDPHDKDVPYLPPLREVLAKPLSWKMFFYAADRLLKAYEPWHFKPLRRYALERVTQWLLEHQEPEGDWGGIGPPMLNGAMALPLQGYGLDSAPMRLGLEAIERFVWRDARGAHMQACVSSVWDTVLGLIGLCDAGMDPRDPRLARAAQWIADKQILDRRGDWAVYRPKLRPGGWSFEYYNTWYPDVDDTAAVLLALLKQDGTKTRHETIHLAIKWLLGMANRDGGWAAFDADNDKLFLNETPVADMKALSDPSTADVTGRIIEALGLALQCHTLHGGLPANMRRRMEAACRRGMRFIEADQKSSGAWFGRWGVNYIYGTSHVLCGLSRLPFPAPAAVVDGGVRWLKKVQNRDGGWGENIASYDDPSLAGKGVSTASQTAWALMGLLAHVPPQDPAIAAGVAWLTRTQAPADVSPKAATWDEPQTTGTGFPQHVYVRYDFYRHYFPMMALGRYQRALHACGLEPT